MEKTSKQGSKTHLQKVAKKRRDFFPEGEFEEYIASIKTDYYFELQKLNLPIIENEGENENRREENFQVRIESENERKNHSKNHQETQAKTEIDFQAERKRQENDFVAAVRKNTVFEALEFKEISALNSKIEIGNVQIKSGKNMLDTYEIKVEDLSRFLAAAKRILDNLRMEETDQTVRKCKQKDEEKDRLTAALKKIDDFDKTNGEMEKHNENLAAKKTLVCDKVN